MRRLALSLIVSCAARAPEPAAIMPSPYRAREAAAVTLNATCAGCHAEQAEAWRGSMHRRAYDNAAFQAAVAVEPTPFCRGCHAPEANASAPAIATELGVACVTCHVTREGTVLAAPSSGARSGAPHSVTRSAAFASVASCRSCHEFPFPGAPSLGEPHLMQTTMLEHARSPAAERSCTTCHRSHSFSEVRDPAWLASQLRVRAEVVRTPSANVARITLEQTAPGHAFPTGDLFRRLAVRVGSETRYLARHFVGARELVRDDRVFDAPSVVTVSIPAGVNEVAWSVTLERVAGIGSGFEPERATIESVVGLHAGVLAVEKD